MDRSAQPQRCEWLVKSNGTRRKPMSAATADRLIVEQIVGPEAAQSVLAS
jgi:hypothetical protein